MANVVCMAVLAGIMAACACAKLASANGIEDTEEPINWEDFLKDVDNTSFVWLKQGISPEDNEKFAKEFAQDREFVTYPTLGGFAVRMKFYEAEARREQLEPPDIDYIEADGLVHGFQAGCDNPSPYPTTSQLPKDLGVQRVEHVNGPVTAPSTARVWVVDSGIAPDFDGTELNVDRTNSRECTPAKCWTRPADRDRIGHGTMIAGIIAAIDNSEGVVGVAQGAKVIPVQIFRGRRPTTDWRAIYNAMDYLLDPSPTVGAEAGDVVNVSWGDDWDPRPGRYPRKIEQLLRDLADRGVKIAVAAGNNDVLWGSGYVLTVTPARAGAYRNTAMGGAVITVSAVKSELVAGNWQDTFWTDSAFGNGELNPSTNFYSGPPDFAEPGVDIESLWPGRQINTCTGTSFAAPHMSGILLGGMPTINGSATGDPSAEMLGTVDARRQDPIGVH